MYILRNSAPQSITLLQFKFMNNCFSFRSSFTAEFDCHDYLYFVDYFYSLTVQIQNDLLVLVG